MKERAPAPHFPATLPPSHSLPAACGLSPPQRLLAGKGRRQAQLLPENALASPGLARAIAAAGSSESGLLQPAGYGGTAFASPRWASGFWRKTDKGLQMKIILDNTNDTIENDSHVRQGRVALPIDQRSPQSCTSVSAKR